MELTDWMEQEVLRDSRVCKGSRETEASLDSMELTD